MNSDLSALLRTRCTAVWFALIAATAVSWALGTDHAIGVGGDELASTLIIVISFVKIRFVAMYFMELRDAPRGLKGLVEGYCGLACAATLITYLWSG